MTVMPKITHGVRVEDKLFQNRYQVDAGRPHITVTPHDKPSAALLALTRVCPAKCYELTESGKVEATVDGCLECGTCRVICAHLPGAMEWNHPRPSFGVQYRFG